MIARPVNRWQPLGRLIRHTATAALAAVAAVCVAEGPQVPGTASAAVQEAQQHPVVPTPASAPTTLRPSSTAPSAALAAYQFPPARRLIAIGDLHGNLPATRRALELAGAIDREGNWAGGDLVVVQTGDMLDRGDEELPLLYWFDRLAEQAQATGGAVHTLVGNHETMNAGGDYHSVTPLGLRAFAHVRPLPHLSPAAYSFPSRAHGRASAFLAGSRYARLLGKRDTIVMVGDTLFVHGGVLPHHVEYGLGRINSEIRAWLSGYRRFPPRSIFMRDGPIWTRLYGASTVPPQICALAEQVLAAVGASRMVIAHTIQDRVNSACDGRVIRVDVGVSGVYGGQPELLEIAGDGVRVLRVGAAPTPVPAGVLDPRRISKPRDLLEN